MNEEALRGLFVAVFLVGTMIGYWVTVFVYEFCSELKKSFDKRKESREKIEHSTCVCGHKYNEHNALTSNYGCRHGEWSSKEKKINCDCTMFVMKK